MQNNRWEIGNQTQPCYLWPTPPDHGLKTNEWLVQSSYNGNTIVEWNIDGTSEYEITKTLVEMAICVICYERSPCWKCHQTPYFWFYKLIKNLMG